MTIVHGVYRNKSHFSHRQLTYDIFYWLQMTPSCSVKIMSNCPRLCSTNFDNLILSTFNRNILRYQLIEWFAVSNMNGWIGFATTSLTFIKKKHLNIVIEAKIKLRCFTSFNRNDGFTNSGLFVNNSSNFD